MRALLLAFACLPPLAGCTTVQTYGSAVIEERRIMNDMQARATMAATCDIALGAYFRELSSTERAYAGLVCGGILPAAPTQLPAQPMAFDERPQLMPLPPGFQVGNP